MSASRALPSGRKLGLPLEFSIAAACALAIWLSAGCTGNVAPAPVMVVREPPRTPTEVLERMVEAYHEANSYQDAGRLLIRYTHDGEIVSQDREFSLAASGPNRLRMRAYDALVVCDGHALRAVIDEAPGEVLGFAAPEELSPAHVYSDAVLASALNQIVGSLPLSLYLDPEPLPVLLLNSHKPELDSPAKIGDDECFRVRIDRREGSFVLWIDQRTFVLRRVEYPPGGYQRMLEGYVGPISDMTITAEIVDARLDPPIDDATFEFQMPAGAELVKRFDALRPGSRVPRFKLHALDGRTITRDSLADKVAVIKFWQQAAVLNYYKDLAGFDQVAKQFADQDSVVFLAVSPDLDAVSDADLQAAFDKAELSLPIARIDRKAAYRSFGLQTVPVTVILGRDGTLQEYILGPYPNQHDALAKKIDTLLAGGDLTLEAPEAPKEYMFYTGFDWKTIEAPSDEASETQGATSAGAGISPASEPEFLRLKRLWVCRDARQPGNILVVPAADGDDKVYVLEGLPSVVEIGADGKRAATHKLELPERDDSAIAFVRTAADGAGRRYFLGSKSGVQQVHLFDADWKRLLSYPESPDHPGISDALLADLDADGELEMLIGYLQAVGIHAVSLDGQRLWRNRAAENVLHMDVTGPDRRGHRELLAAQGQGLILPIDSDGRDRAPIVLPDAFVRLIFTADLDGDERAEWCAIAQPVSPDETVRDVAFGLSPRGDLLWNYPLPAGAQRHPAFEMVVAGNLLDSDVALWAIGAADGSIHLVGADGSAIDQFNVGSALAGLAVAHFNGRATLLASTDEGVEAWQFESPADDNTADE